jgi:hypothetical protein
LLSFAGRFVLAVPVLDVLFWMSCYSCPCSGCPVLDVLFWMSCLGCPVLAAVFWLPYSGFPVRCPVWCLDD